MLFFTSKRKNPKSSLESSAAPPLPSSDLWDLVVDRDWGSVVRHVAEHPHDAAWFDGHYRESILYLLMQSSPPNSHVVQTIVDAHPDAIMEKCTKNHDLPLHIACRYQLSANILKVLIRNNFVESTIVQTRWGNTPLKALYEYRVKAAQENRQISRHQITLQDEQQHEQQEDPQQPLGNDVAILEDISEGQADQEDDEEDNQVTDDDIDVSLRQGVYDVDDDSQDDIHADTEFWEKVYIILEGVARYQNFLRVEHQSTCGGRQSTLTSTNATSELPLLEHPSNDFLFVHAATSLGSMGCPFPVFERILADHPQEVRQVDHLGRLPFHLAIGPSRWTQSGSRSGGGGQRKYRPREGRMIARLLEMYPDAGRMKICVMSSTTGTYPRNHSKYNNQSTTSHNTILPLHYALMNRHWWSDGVRDILMAYPQALTIREVQTKLFPFQLAAMIPQDRFVNTVSVDLETIFQLLRSDPTVLDLLLENKKKKSSSYYNNCVQDGYLCLNLFRDTIRSQNIVHKCTTQMLSFRRLEKSFCSTMLKETLVGCVTALLIGICAGMFLEESSQSKHSC